MTISFSSKSTSTGATITLPASVDGKLLVLMQYGRDNASPPSDVTPSGWTDVGAAVNIAGNRVRMSCKYRIATTMDSSATVTGIDGGTDGKILFVFSSDGTITGVSPQDLAGEITNGDPAQQTINASAGAEPLIALAGYGVTHNFTIASDTFSPSASQATSSGIRHKAACKIYNSSAMDTTVDLPDIRNDNALHSFYLEITEGGGGGADMSGTAAGAATVTGELNIVSDISGTAAGVATATGFLNFGFVTLSGTASGSATVTGHLTKVFNLSGTAAGVGAGSGVVNVTVNLSGTSAGLSTPSGVLNINIPLSGTAAGTSTATGFLNQTSDISGTAAGVASATGFLDRLSDMSGTAAGAATVSGFAEVLIGLTGTSAGTSTVSGFAKINVAMVGTSDGTATVSGIIRVEGFPSIAYVFDTETKIATLPAERTVFTLDDEQTILTL